jgi:hypothetical protein
MQSTKSGALSAALCLLLGAANIHAQARPPAGDQSDSDLHQVRQRMMDRRRQDFPEQDGPTPGLAPNRSGPVAKAADERDPGGIDRGPRYEGRFQDGPAAPGGPAPFMRDGGRRFGHPGRPSAFRAQPDGGPGFPPPPMRGWRPEREGFSPYSGGMDRGSRYEGRFQDGPGAPGGPAPFMRDGDRGFGHPGKPGAFRAQPDAGPGFPPPPMRGWRPEREGFSPYPGDMDRGSRYEGQFQDGPVAPGGPAPFTRDGDRGFGHPGGQRQPEDE